MPEEKDGKEADGKLTEWFKTLRNIAFELAIGSLVSFGFIQTVESRMPKELFANVNSGLIIIFSFSCLLSGSKALKIARNKKNVEDA